MELLIDALRDAGRWLLANDGEVALAVVATALIIFGEDINAIVRRALKPFNFLIRFLGFVALCALGYGFITVYATRFLTKILHQVDLVYIPLFVAVAFIALALVANRRNHI